MGKNSKHFNLEELVSFGKELGFETCALGIFLPLEKRKDYEFGILSGGLYPVVYFKNSEGKVVFGRGVTCFTPEMIIKTLKTKKSELIIDKRIEKNYFLSDKALIQAFLFKDIGSIDSSFLKSAYKKIFPIIPKDVKKNFVKEKFEELGEKNSELKLLKNHIGECDYKSAKVFLDSEIMAYFESDVKCVSENSSFEILQKIYEILLVDKCRVYDAKEVYYFSNIKPNPEILKKSYEILLNMGMNYDAAYLIEWSGLNLAFFDKLRFFMLRFL